MKAPDPPQLLPHEMFFGLFLVVTWLRLGLALGFFGTDALLYFALILGNLWAIWFCRSNGTAVRWRIGLLFYPVAMNVIFMHMKTAIPKIHPDRMDGWRAASRRAGRRNESQPATATAGASGAHGVPQFLLHALFPLSVLQPGVLFLR